MSKKNIKEWSRVLQDNNQGILELKLKNYIYIAEKCIEDLNDKAYYNISPEDTISNDQFDMLYSLYLYDISEGILKLSSKEITSIIIPNIKNNGSYLDKVQLCKIFQPKELLTKSHVELTMGNVPRF